ncbi:hypothetical protein CDD82_3235 [Ophiocordyceps australis]|uniref:Methylated-DNA--protein-cysteine methyltransferase n=1 Tax=Ophiocordyceps australis TaxID=1399860 RepID=A0A2C5YYL0_9HYPO|nr:hypothetical protein CDD82_3235 [Ophiocordyceps australis]
MRRVSASATDRVSASKPAGMTKAIKRKQQRKPTTSKSATHRMDDNMSACAIQALITQSERSPFEKRVWTALCQIPRGSVTTYGLLSAHLGSSPRAVGNALRRNPFAPQVPCHRVVATGMALGGFRGDWARHGVESMAQQDKRSLLKGEGVKFDDGGKVLGTPWAGWAKIS